MAALDDECLLAAASDPNLAGITSIDELHAKLKALSIVLQTKDHPDSAFSRMKFKGTHPNPIYKPNAFKAEKGQDGRHISSYYRYAVKDEATVTKALGKAAPGPRKPGVVANAVAEKAAPSGAGGAAKPKPGSFARRLSVSELMDAIRAKDPSVKTADFSGQATFQMKSDEKLVELCAALASDGGDSSPVTHLILKNCGIDNAGAATLGQFLAENTTVTHLDLSENKAIKDDGGVALARGIATDTALLEVNLMGLGGGVAIRSEAICAAFIEAFATNLTLKKPVWRLDHPLAHTLARLVTRNNSIARSIDQGKPFESLLPDPLKSSGVVVHGVSSTDARM